MVLRLGSAAVGILGLLMIVSALLEARFALMSRSTTAVVVRLAALEGTTARSEQVRIQGRPIETRLVSDRYLGEAPVLEFEVDGRKVEFFGQVQGTTSSYPIGARVEIIYDPWNPERALIAAEAAPWAGVLGGAFFGAVLVFVALAALVVFGGWGRYFPSFRLT